MAKILVADDNSNVQKTVALALADLGIEVIAVNNGEAAVKKLPDVMPDLVLADIFMPVRNGYEVCEYVKKDARFAQLPVVLLVGAFDPLDEREAQRVGADGILKKPFVPPDPLIAMVSTLLERTAGERNVSVPVPKPAAAKQSRSGGVAVADDHNSESMNSEDSLEEPMSPMPTRMSFEDSEGLVAFSQLLDTPDLKASASNKSSANADVDDNEQILTSKRDEALGAPIFWKTDNPEQEAHSGDAETTDEEAAEIPALGWRLGTEPPTAAEADADSRIPDEPLVLVRDDKDEAQSQVSTIVEASPLLVQDPATQASLNVEASRAEDLAANPLEWMASVPLPKQEEKVATADVFEWSPSVPEPTDRIEVKEPAPLTPATDLVGAELPPVIVPPAAPMPAAADGIKSGGAFPISQPPISPIPEAALRIATQAPAGSAQSVEDTVRSAVKQDRTNEPARAGSMAQEPADLESAAAPGTPKESGIAEPAEAIPEAWTPAIPASKTGAQSGEDATNSKSKRDWADLVADLKSQTGELNLENEQRSAKTIHKNASVMTKAPEVVVAQPETVSKPSSSVEDTARSLPKLDWADLAASIQPQASESAAENVKIANVVHANASAAPSLNAKSNPISALAAALDRSAARQGNGANSAATSESEASSASSLPANPGVPDPALVEAVVQRVLDKMRPQVVDIITKEFLRPVVQALVHREITKR